MKPTASSIVPNIDPNIESNIELAIRDIHLPDSILWWPIAPGWWILLLLVLLIIISIIIYKKTYFKRTLKKNTRHELVSFYDSYKKNGDAKIFIQQLSAFLRRVALYRYNKNENVDIANLHGKAWLEFLDSKLPQTKTAHKNPNQLSFQNGVGKIFLTGPYQLVLDDDLVPVYKLVEKWLNYNFKNKYGLI